MDSLYLLIPLSVLLVFGILAVFAWALFGGQFDEIDREGARILEDDMPLPSPPRPRRLDARQDGSAVPPSDSAATRVVPGDRADERRPTPHS